MQNPEETDMHTVHCNRAVSLRAKREDKPKARIKGGPRRQETESCLVY